MTRFPLVGDIAQVRSYRRASIEIKADVSSPYLLLVGVAMLIARHTGREVASIGYACSEIEQPYLLNVQARIRRDQCIGEVLQEAHDWIVESQSRGDKAPAECPVLVVDRDIASTDNTNTRQLRKAIARSQISFLGSKESNTILVDFDSDSFDERAATNITEQLQVLCDALSVDRAQALENIDLLTPEQRAEVLSFSEFDSSKPYRTIPSMFSERVQITPDKTAILFENESLTYAELDRRANAVSSALRSCGVSEGDRVGVSLERSIELVVALLGVLKTGSAYVPIDPHIPLERQRRIVSLAGLSHGVTRLGVVADDLFSKSIDVDQCTANDVSMDVALDPMSPAYVLFTSGSTGDPKGVAVAHHSVTRLITTSNTLFEFHSSDVWLNAHTFAFDVSVWEIFGALLTGATLVVPTREAVRNPEAMTALVEDRGISILTTTPTAFQGFTTEAVSSAVTMSSLRYVVFCGEMLRCEALGPWFHRWGDESPQLINMYGITEATVHSSFYRVRESDVRDPRSKIGRGLPDTPIYVLDENRRPVPIGVEGEIFVGGPGIALGYVTASQSDHLRFGADPLSNGNDMRLYRSGDRGRWLADGGIEYLGRRDQQVKIRGFRVELGEIERRLRIHDGVVDARVWVHNRDGAPYMVACVVPASGITLNSLGLKSWVADALPEYMVPVAIVIRGELPLTVNGKFDQKALADVFSEEDNHLRVAPVVSERDEAILAIVSDVLGFKVRDVKQNFFRLGGDSITAVRLVAGLRAIKIDVDLADVYRSASISALTNSPNRDTSSVSGDRVEVSVLSREDRSLVPSSAVDAYPATRLQIGMFFHTLLNGEHVYHDVFSYEFATTFDEAQIHRALEIMVREHATLRTGFLVDGPSVPLQIVFADADIQCLFVAVPKDGNLRDAVDRWAEDERNLPFDWKIPGLLRLAVHRQAERSVLSLSFHHAILDGWSVASFVTELMETYSRVHSDANAPLEHAEDDPIIREYVRLELASIESELDAAFWQKELNGVQALEFGRDVRVGEAYEEDAPRVEISRPIDPATIGLLGNLAEKLNVPRKTIFLAAYSALMSHLSSTEDIVVGVVTNGRVEDAGGDAALGLFLNTTPYRQRHGAQDWSQLIQSVFEFERRMSKHRRYPYELIQQLLGIDRLCPAAFNYTSFHVYSRLTQLGLKIDDIRYREQTDFDLLLSVSEDPFIDETSVALSVDPLVMTPSSARECLAHYAELLDSIATDSLVSVDAALARLVQFERRSEIVAEQVGLPQSVLNLMQRQFSARGNEIACTFEDNNYTYTEIERRVALVGQELLRKGVKPGHRVACILERGVDPVVALLACWSVRATYVPIDPELPSDRQLRLLRKSNSHIALMSTGLDRDVVKELAIPIVALGLESDAVSHRWDMPNPEDEAYILFTSGSTGEPKAVCIPHRSMSNLVAWQLAQPEFSGTPTVSQFAPLSFDVSVQEMSATLAAGGRLVVVGGETRRNPQEFLELLVEREINVVFLPPAILRQLSESSRLFRLLPSTISAFITAGEALVIDESVRKFCGSIEATVINQYGPTETHVVTHKRLESDPGAWSDRPSIGHPLWNVRTRVCDDAGACVPIGTDGELWITGPSVAIGYVDSEGIDPRTSERFVSVGADRYYRTGDIVNQSKDGEIRFVSRLDDQLKIRGFRIEPGEVVATLLQHDDVADAFVRGEMLSSGHQELVAYVVGPVDVEPLRGFLASRLPKFAIPTQIHRMDTLPRTRTGKVDALSIPVVTSAPERGMSMIVDGDTEQRVLESWAEVLGRPVQSPTATFFELGGTSLMILKLYLELRKRFDVEFKMYQLFRHPTARGFSQFLDNTQSDAQKKPAMKREVTSSLAARRRAARGRNREA